MSFPEPDGKLSISLKHIQHIIDRVHDRYPIISKQDTTVIIKVFFETMRSILLARDSITINNFFKNLHLISFNKIRKNKFSRIVKVKLSTPRKMKND